MCDYTGLARGSRFFFFAARKKHTEISLPPDFQVFAQHFLLPREILILIDDRGAGSPKLKRCRPQSSLVARDLPSQLPGFGGEVTAATKARPSTWIRAQRGTGTSALCRRGCRWRGEASANPSERCLSGVRLGRGLAWCPAAREHTFGMRSAKQWWSRVATARASALATPNTATRAVHQGKGSEHQHLYE